MGGKYCDNCGEAINADNDFLNCERCGLEGCESCIDQDACAASAIDLGGGYGDDADDGPERDSYFDDPIRNHPYC